MSWIWGYSGPEHAMDLAAPAPQKFSRIDRKFATGRIFAGGPERTCFDLEASENEGWTVCGTPLKHSDHYGLLQASEWGQILHEAKNATRELEGHFVAAHWINGDLRFYTDRLGIRDIYFATVGELTYFSTRLDWLPRSKEHSLDLQRFSSRWMLANQLSSGSLFHGVTRLLGGSSAQLREGKLDVEPYEWWPRLDLERSDIPAYDLLNDLTHLAKRESRPLTLCLSGGLDSRVLAALLTDAPNWEAHTYGDPNHPDATIARSIANSRGVPFRQLKSPLPSVSDALQMAEEFVAQTCLSHPASSILQLQYFQEESMLDRLMIDGGWGEIARRQLFNKLLYTGRKAILNGDVIQITRILRASSSSFFAPEFSAQLEQEIIAETEECVNRLKWAKHDPELWVDLLALKTRLPNGSAGEQTRMDGLVQSIMPFIQPSFIEASWNIPLSERKQDRLFMRILKERAPELTRIPLVKNHTVYPFGLPKLAAFAYKRIKERFGKAYHDTLRTDFLALMRPVIEEYASSSSVGSCELYDSKAVRHLVSDYYSGTESRAVELDRWFTLELFRRKMEV